MKQILLSLVFIFLHLVTPLNLLAQQKLTEFPVKIPRPGETFICSNPSGLTACVFQNNKQYEIDFLDSDFKLVQSSISPKIKTDRNQKIIGAILDEEQCTAYFYNKKIKAFSSLTVNQKSGQTSFSRIQVLNPTDQFLRAFEMNGKFYILIVPKYGKSLKVLVLKGIEKEEISFDIEMAGFYNLLSQQNTMLNNPAESEVGIEEISYKLGNDVKSSYPDKKLYHFNDKIFLVFDESGMTHLITIYINEKKSDYKKLIFDLERGNYSNQKQGNSFLYGNKLFRTTISPEQLNISILDLDSMVLINSYNFYPNEDISILNGPIIVEGGSASLFIPSEKTLARTDEYFKRVLDGNLSIAANKIDSNSYEIQLGSYEIYQTSYRNGYGRPGLSIGIGMGGMGMGMGGMGMGGIGMGGMGMGGMGMGGFGSPYSGFGSQSVTRQRLTYFKSILGNEKFEHIDGNVPTNLKDRINDYESKAFRSNAPEVLRITPYKNSVLLGYYSKISRQFKIIEFGN